MPIILQPFPFYDALPDVADADYQLFFNDPELNAAQFNTRFGMVGAPADVNGNHFSGVAISGLVGSFGNEPFTNPSVLDGVPHWHVDGGFINDGEVNLESGYSEFVVSGPLLSIYDGGAFGVDYLVGPIPNRVGAWPGVASRSANEGWYEAVDIGYPVYLEEWFSENPAKNAGIAFNGYTHFGGLWCHADSGSADVNSGTYLRRFIHGVVSVDAQAETLTESDIVAGVIYTGDLSGGVSKLIVNGVVVLEHVVAERQTYVWTRLNLGAYGPIEAYGGFASMYESLTLYTEGPTSDTDLTLYFDDPGAPGRGIDTKDVKRITYFDRVSGLAPGVETGGVYEMAPLSMYTHPGWPAEAPPTFDHCNTLEKNIEVTYVRGTSGQSASPGSPARSAYCSTTYVTSCGYFLNPDVQLTWVQDQNGQWVQVYTLNGQTGGYFYAPLTTYQCISQPVTTCYPATQAVPPTPYVAPTPAQLITTYNLGWNTWSRTIEPFAVGRSFNFTVVSGNHGTFIGLAPSGKEGQSIALFDWAVVADISGVHVMENGLVVHTLASSYNTFSDFSIDRTLTGDLIYRLDSDFYISAAPPSTTETLYPYAYLYSGGDKVKCSGYSNLDAEVLSSISFSGSGTLLTAAPSVDGQFFASIVMSGSGSLSVEQPYPFTITLSAESSLLVGFNTISGYGALPALSCVASDYAYSFVDGAMPALEGSGAAYTYTPPVPTKVFGELPQLQFYGYAQTVEVDHIEGTLPMLEGIGGDYNYASVYGTLYEPVGQGTEGTRLDMSAMGYVIAYDHVDIGVELVLVLNSAGQLQSVYTDDMLKVQDYISAAMLQSVYEPLGVYNLTSLSGGRLLSLNVASIDGAAAVHAGRVWVLNVETSASVQYDNYGFNSFFTRDGVSYGVADDGIYRLTGDKDVSKEIVAQVDTGITTLGSPMQKSLPAVYLNASSDGALVVKVETDGSDPYYYEARSSSESLDKHRVDVGRGLKGVNWSVTVMNQSGEDFELAGVELTPIQATRRI